MLTWTERSLKIPKYLRLADQLKQQIESGVLRPDDRLPSFPQMRAQFGITNNTVEKVYDLLERDGLIVRQPSRGTFVAGPKKPTRKPRKAAPVKSRHATIGVSGLGFAFAGNSSYWSRLLQGMREAASRAEAQLLLLPHDSFAGWEKADGVLLCDYVSSEVLRALPEGMPRVALVMPYADMAAASADDYQGGRLATEHLLSLGHRRIAYLHGEGDALHARREAGYVDTLKAAGITLRPEWMHSLLRPWEYGYNYGNDFVRAGRDGMASWLQDKSANGFRKLRCTAILAHNDEVAVGIIQALREAGLSVPRDVSVIGYDGVEIGEYSSPRLTTIEVPLREIGQAATEMVLHQIGLDESTVSNIFEHRVLPIQLRVRESTSAPSPNLLK